LHFKFSIVTTQHIPDEILCKVRTKVILPLKDAMRLTDYKEHDRNYKFYFRKKIKGTNKQLVLRSYSFKLSGTLKHEMYLKALNPAYIKGFLGKDHDYKVIMKPDKPIDLEYDSKNKRSIELVVYFK
jgi:hypothetical protein